MNLLSVSVGIGLVVSLLFTEIFGVASAGLVVPGYLALYVHDPLQIVATLGVAFCTYAIVRVLATFVVVYGRRRTVLMILVGYVIGMLARQWVDIGGVNFQAIGFIIPGLIGIWMDRQGVPQTLASIAVVTGFVRLVLVLVVGDDLLP